MCTPCTVNKPAELDLLPSVQSLSLADLNTLSQQNQKRLGGMGIVHPEATAPENTVVHTTSGGGVFLTTSSAGGLQGDVTLTGSIGPLPVELHMTVRVDPAAATVTVTLELIKPIHLPPYTWTFKLGGVARDANKNLIGAQSLTLSPDTPAFEAAGIGSHFLCFLKCAGLAILPILIECLPSFATGPQGFIACVVAKAGSCAASIRGVCGKVYLMRPGGLHGCWIEFVDK
jgi:hypothetical protein